MNNQILEITDNYIYDIKFKHLEYFPMVNSRMFSIGGLENQDDFNNLNNKQILNTQFKQQYN